VLVEHLRSSTKSQREISLRGIQRLQRYPIGRWAEQGGQPDRRIGRILGSKVLGRRRVTLVVRLNTCLQETDGFWLCC
jgi:hypothetical protein